MKSQGFRDRGASDEGGALIRKSYRAPVSRFTNTQTFSSNDKFCVFVPLTYAMQSNTASEFAFGTLFYTIQIIREMGTRR